MAKTPNSPPTFPCPICRQPVAVGLTACPNPNCQVDLKSLAIVDTISDSLFLLAQQQIQQGETRKAIETLENVIAYAPQHLEAWLGLGSAYSSAGNTGEAVRCWQKVVQQIQPDEPRAQAELAKVRAAEEAERRKARQRQLLLSALPAVVLGLVFITVLAVVLTGRPPVAQATAAPTAVLASGQATSPNPTPTAAVADLTGPVAAALRGDPALKDFNLLVEQSSQAVLISGQVPSEALKDQVGSVARKVEGVSLVDTTQLSVVPPALADAVREKLASNKQLAGQTVVVTQEGISILLSGSVETVELKQLAEELAGGVEGVTLVDSRSLAVRPPSLIEQVTAGLKADPRTTCFNIAVNQQGSSVSLEGKVFSQQALETIELLVHRVAGVEGVDLTRLTIEPIFGEYVVQPFDYLEKVALNVYGSSDQSKLIYDANPGKFPLQPGFVLAIPPLDIKIGGLPVIDCTNMK